MKKGIFHLSPKGEEKERGGGFSEGASKEVKKKSVTMPSEKRFT